MHTRFVVYSKEKLLKRIVNFNDGSIKLKGTVSISFTNYMANLTKTRRKMKKRNVTKKKNSSNIKTDLTLVKLFHGRSLASKWSPLLELTGVWSLICACATKKKSHFRIGSDEFVNENNPSCSAKLFNLNTNSSVAELPILGNNETLIKFRITCSYLNYVLKFTVLKQLASGLCASRKRHRESSSIDYLLNNSILCNVFSQSMVGVMALQYLFSGTLRNVCILTITLRPCSIIHLHKKPVSLIQ